MSTLNIKTPDEYLIREVEKNEKLLMICEKLNEVIDNSFTIAYTPQRFVLEVTLTEKLSDLETLLLQRVYKLFKWKLYVAPHTTDGEFNYKFTLYLD